MRKPRRINKSKKNYKIASEPEKPSFHWEEIIGIVLLACGVFLFLSACFPDLAGYAGIKLKNALRESMGYGGYVLPWLIIITGLQFIIPHPTLTVPWLIAALIILQIDLCAFFQVLAWHGGDAGHWVYKVSFPVIGKAGLYVLTIAVGLIDLLIITQISLRRLAERVAPWARILFKKLFPAKVDWRKYEQIEFEEMALDEMSSSDSIIYPAQSEIEAAGAREGTVQADTAADEAAPVSAEVPENGKTEPEISSEDLQQLKLFEEKEEKPEEAPVQKIKVSYKLPSVNLLKGIEKTKKSRAVQDYSKVLVETLQSFGVEVTVSHIERGPTVTRYELQPAKGVKVSKITNLANDIALALAAQAIRIEAPIPGKSAIGIEIPNLRIDPVHVMEILASPAFRRASKTAIALGKDITGKPVVGELIKMPHLLIAGATGSGKTVCINAILASFLFKCSPYDLQFVMIDPKRVELIIYEGLPHLVDTNPDPLKRIVTDPKTATLVLKQMTDHMDERYEKFASVRARNILEYNAYQAKTGGEKMPYIVVIVDELADLMMISASSVESFICRLAQLGRAAGIHLIIATQRPSVDVITGLIKANIPSRIAFAVSSQVDSRTILDGVGAEKLLGKGDMLYKPIDAADSRRIQGAFIDMDEIERVVEFWKKQPPPYNILPFNVEEDKRKTPSGQEGEDPLFDEALRIIHQKGEASVSILQRKLKIGYARAGRLIDLMEQKGIVGQAEGSKPRKILIPINKDI